MGKIDIPDGNINRFFEPDEIICMKALRECTTIYFVDPLKDKGYGEITAAYCLKHFEEKVWCLPFMRVHEKWVVGLKHIKGIAKNNTITLTFSCCEGICVDPKLRQLLHERLKIVQTA